METTKRKGLFENNGEDFKKGDKVRLGDGRSGTVVSRVERNGFSGYQVKITNSSDASQVGEVVGASPSGMKLARVERQREEDRSLMANLKTSQKSNIVGFEIGDKVLIVNAKTAGRVMDIEIELDGSKTYTILPDGGGMRLKRQLQALRLVGTNSVGGRRATTSPKRRGGTQSGRSFELLSSPQDKARPDLSSEAGAGGERRGFAGRYRHCRAFSPLPDERSPHSLKRKALFVNLPDIDDGGELTDMQVLRLAIIAELDAISLYEKLSKRTHDQDIGDVLNSIIVEEKTHVGELDALLNVTDAQQAVEKSDGAAEVADILGEGGGGAMVEASRRRASDNPAGMSDEETWDDINQSLWGQGIQDDLAFSGGDTSDAEIRAAVLENYGDMYGFADKPTYWWDGLIAVIRKEINYAKQHGGSDISAGRMAKLEQQDWDDVDEIAQSLGEANYRKPRA